MDPDPDRDVGCTDLSGESDFHPAAPVIAATPAVTRPGAGPSSAMVTRSRARGGREINIEPEVEFFPEVEIPAETVEEGFGATRHITDISSQYTPEVAIAQEVITSASVTTTPPIITRNLPPHTGSLTLNLQPAGRSVTSLNISGAATPTLSYYGDLPIADSASRAHAFVGDDLAIQPHGKLATHGDMSTHSEMATKPHGDVAMQPLGDMAIWQ